MSHVIERLKNNLLFEDTPEAKKLAKGMLCIPFKEEDQAGAQELFEALKSLTAKYEAAREGLTAIIQHQQEIAGTPNVNSVCSSIAKKALDISQL